VVEQKTYSKNVVLFIKQNIVLLLLLQLGIGCYRQQLQWQQHTMVARQQLSSDVWTHPSVSHQHGYVTQSMTVVICQMKVHLLAAQVLVNPLLADWCTSSLIKSCRDLLYTVQYVACLCCAYNSKAEVLLHFVWGVAEAKSMLVIALCVFFYVCVSVPRHIFTLLHWPKCKFEELQGLKYWVDLQSVHGFHCQHIQCNANTCWLTSMLFGQLPVKCILTRTLFSQLPVKFEKALRHAIWTTSSQVHQKLARNTKY